MPYDDNARRDRPPPAPRARTPDDDLAGAPDWLRAMLHDAGLPTSEQSSAVADRLTAQSRSVAAVALAAAGGEHLSAAEDASEARVAPAARAMLGWTDAKPELDDEFAARLMAAFQSGALDLKPGVSLDQVSDTPAVPNRAPAGREPKPEAPRAHATLRPEFKHPKYSAPSVVARPLYTPW